MAVDFPAGPSNGQKFTAANGVTYVYVFAKNAWQSEASIVDYVNVTGDTMTGALTLPAANPATATQAAHKSYVDTKSPLSNVTAGTAGYVQTTSSATGNALSLPAGGTWDYQVTSFNGAGGVVSLGRSVLAGGSVIASAVAGVYHIAHLKRIA